MMAAIPNSLTRLRDVCIAELRGLVDDVRFKKKCRSVLGEMPERVGLATATEGLSTLRLSPDCWWIRGSAGTISGVEEAFSGVIEEGWSSFVLLSPGISSYRLGGGDAAAILARGTSVDLHPNVFGSHRCCRTLHAGVAVTIYRADAAETNPAYDLHVDTSFDHFIGTWFERVGKPYAMQMMI